ncbi:hypothetical protein IAT38_008456 [Cryptococcus sp. DSM 104549]
MSPPGRKSVPIPNVNNPPEGGPVAGSHRKKGHVMQSSLELVFSYSRSQQMRYGGHLHTAPSFVDESSSLRHPSSQEDGDFPDHAEYDEDQYYDRDVANRWEQLEGASPLGAQPGAGEGGDAAVERGPNLAPGAEGYERRHSEAPAIFHADDFPGLSPTDTTQPKVQSPKTIPPGAGAGTGAGATGSPTPGLISINMFSPRVAPSQLGSSMASGVGSGAGGARGGTATAGSSGASAGLGRGRAGAGAPGLGLQREGTRGSVSSAAASVGPQKGQDGVEGEGAPLLGDGRRRETYAAVVAREGVGRRRRSSGRRRRVVEGESTDGQTLFNATAVLVGIGLLSLPLAFAYSGWIAGSAMLLGFGWLTCHTAKLLARLIFADRSMLGYTDIGKRAFGRWAGAAINCLFCLELFALGVALVVLFGDTLNILYPSITSNTWKLIGFFIIVPTALLPLRLLSLPSLLSSISSLLLILVLLIDGLVKPDAPGSLRSPMATHVWPEVTGGNWLGGIGLVLAGFGGHAVMPSLARDMKHPENFDRVIDKAFAIATAISFVAGAAGYLMIGPNVSDEITRDLMQEKYHYPRVLNIIALWMIVINPLTKFGLASRPLNVTLESIIGIAPIPIPLPPSDSALESGDLEPLPGSSGKTDRTTNPRSSSFSIQTPSYTNPRRRSSSLSPTRRLSHSQAQGQAQDRPHDSGISHASSHAHYSHSQIALLHVGERRKAAWRVVSRTVVTAACTLTAVALPGFGRVMAFLGSFSAFLICIILPLLFYIRLSPILIPSTTKHDWKTRASSAGHWALVVLSVGLMVGGTVWAFLPGSGHGELDP